MVVVAFLAVGVVGLVHVLLLVVDLGLVVVVFAVVVRVCCCCLWSCGC